MRIVLAGNVLKLLAKHCRINKDGHKLHSLTAKQRYFAELTGVGFGTIQRICLGQSGANLETIEAVAQGFGLMLYQLFVPALDVDNPQVVKGATAEEQRLYRLFKQNKLTPETLHGDNAAPQ